jgi:hypothetical protein
MNVMRNKSTEGNTERATERNWAGKRRAVLWTGVSALALVAVTASASTVSPAAVSPRSGGRPSVARSGSPLALSSSAAAVPEVAIGQFTGRKPAEIDFSADGGNVVTAIRWTTWTASEATGDGRSGIESCVPNCALGSVRYVPAGITLSAPVNGKFTSVAEYRAGRALTMKWPATWPLGASSLG